MAQESASPAAATSQDPKRVPWYFEKTGPSFFNTSRISAGARYIFPLEFRDASMRNHVGAPRRAIDGSYAGARSLAARRRGEAAISYETLAASLKDLQTAALEQHDYVVKLEGQITTLTRVVAQLATATPGLRMTTLPTLKKPPLRPDLPAPPDFDVAQMRP